MKLAVELGNDLNAKTHLGDYPLVGTSESMLAHYPDNFRRSGGSRHGRRALGWLYRLHGAVLCNQPSILQYLLDKGADPTIKSRLGWTPYTLTQGIFMANSKKEFPVAAQILKKALAEKGQTVASRE